MSQVTSRDEEAFDRFRDFGRVLSVTERAAGANLVVDADASDTVLFVDDATDFGEEAGQAYIYDDTASELINIVDVDHDADSITIDPGLTDPWVDGDRITLEPEVLTRRAMVAIDGAEDDALEALVPAHLGDYLKVGSRNDNEQERVTVEWEPETSTWIVIFAWVPAGITKRWVNAWSAPGDLEVKVYLPGWVAVRDYWIRGAAAIVGYHDGGTHPADGPPDGASIEWNLLAHDFAGNEEQVFTADLTIADASHESGIIGENYSGFARNYVLKGEALFLTITQVGSTTPGSDMGVAVLFEDKD